jgi:hypothetical protein
MFRFILFALLAVILISLLRTIIGVVMKGLGDFASSPQSPPQESPKGKASPRLGGDLHRDPICGTFVAESTPFQRRTASQVFYYCSDVCREKHALVAR